jgi:cell division protein FtsL
MAARRVTRGGRRPRGRAVVFALLLAFVLVASAVVWRRSHGIAIARELAQLERTRLQLLAERTALEGDVRTAASRGRLQGVAEQRLGMRVPSDTQVVILRRSASRPAAGRDSSPATP